MPVRLHKFMADCGVAARRKCEELISSGRVSVNGLILTLPGTTVDPEKDTVLVDGKPIAIPEKLEYYALNKPVGVVVTVSDSHGAPTVMDLMADIGTRIFPVGRLDQDTDGLLIMTNDGLMANRMMHPRYHLEKEYLVTVARELPERSMRYLCRGIILDGTMTQPAALELSGMGRNQVRYRMVIREGRKRQIRRMFKAIGHEVLRLRRISIGPVKLGRLDTGEFRPLSRVEIAALKDALGLGSSKDKKIKAERKTHGDKRQPPRQDRESGPRTGPHARTARGTGKTKRRG